MLSQTFRSFVIQADYLLNKSYIANNLCINQNKPALRCNGKCYLARQLKEQEKQERQAPNTKKEKFEQPFFLPTTSAVTHYTLPVTNNYYHTREHLITALIPSIFHPPTA